MLIGINLLYLIPGKVGGTETYARELLPKLAKTNKLILFCGNESAATFAQSKNIQIVNLGYNASNRVIRLIVEQTILPILISTYKIDVLFSLGYTAPIIHFCPSVVTIHDLNWYYHPEDFSLINRVMWQVLTRVSARFSNHVITDSTASADSIRKVLKITNVTPILHATPTKIKVKEYVYARPYIFSALANYPHKNLQILIKAFKNISKQFPDLDMIICGLGKQNKSSERIKYLGYVTREELVGLYQGALAFIFPSAYEGFGYPVLEAMSYGTPVISSSAYSLSEVVGEGGILVDPADIQGFSSAIAEIYQSKTLRSRLIKRGTKRSLELKWDATAKKTLHVLKAVAKL